LEIQVINTRFKLNTDEINGNRTSCDFCGEVLHCKEGSALYAISLIDVRIFYIVKHFIDVLYKKPIAL